MVRIPKSAAIILDTKGYDKIVAALSPEKRKPVLDEAMRAGAGIVQKSIRTVYKTAKPDSNLDKAIVRYIYPSAEGAIVRRFYVKGGMGRNYSGDSPFYRSYILNFLEKGAQDRKTKGRGKYHGMQLNRGSIPPLKFFSKGRSRARNKAFKEIERILLVGLAKQAMK